MRVLFDTNVILAAHITSHPFFIRADSVYSAHTQNPQDQSFIAQHTLAELYCNLTRLPLGKPLNPVDARKLLEESILKHVSIVEMNASDSRALLGEMEKNKVEGAATYDALIAYCAQKMNVDKLYTFNTKHFLRVWPAGTGKIVEP